MGRLRRPSPDEVTPEVRDAFIKFKAERGNIPNMFRTIAHRPEIAATLLAHYRAVMGPGTVPGPITARKWASIVSRISGR